MKRDIEWLKAEISKRDKGTIYTCDLMCLINQLDRPEALSQEWLDENKSSWTKLKIDGYYIPVEKLQNLLVPKQELDVLSQEWIERNTSPVDDEGRLYIWKRDLENLIVPKQGSLETSAPLIVPEDLGVLLEDMELGKSSRYFTMIDALFHYWDTIVGSTIGDFISENKKELIEIILGNRGYEVEEVQRYKVEDGKYTLLCKWESSEGWEVVSLLEIIDDDLPRDRLVFELTEQEIKDYDPRYWAFRKPVDKTDN